MSFDGTITLELSDLIRLGLEAKLRELFVAEPAKVIKFYPEDDTADLELQVKGLDYDESGRESAIDLPTLIGVPVMYFGSSTYINRFPLAPGDPVLVVCCTRSVDRWFQNGAVVDPVDGRMHDLSNAVCIPGLRSSKEIDSEPSRNDHLIVGRVGGPQVRVSSSHVILGEHDATSPVALADKVKDVIDLISAAVSAAKLAAQGGDGGAAAFTAFENQLALPTFTAALSAMAASKVKAK